MGALSIISGLLSLLSGPVASVSKDIKETRIAIENAKNDRERIDLEDRLAVLDARKTTILAAQSDPIERWVRVLLAFPFIIYINKLVLWDKVLELGVTDPLSADLKQILFIVLGGYFVDTIVKRFKR